jgi:hypothetical protein
MSPRLDHVPAVNDAPVAQNDTLQHAEDTPLTWRHGVLANDTDARWQHDADAVLVSGRATAR